MIAPHAAIEQELADLEAGRLDPRMFPHREHLRLAFEMLGRHSFAETLQRFSTGLRLLAANVGRPEIYHETKTVAFLALIAERRARSGVRSWEEFHASNRDLADKRFLEKFYRPADLESGTARQVFVLPQPTPPRGKWSIDQTVGAYAVIFALYIIWSSGMTFFEAQGRHSQLASLASVEIFAAMVFCFRRTRTIGLTLLLGVFLVAAILEISLGSMPVRFVFFAASALLVWWLTPPKRAARRWSSVARS